MKSLEEIRRLTITAIKGLNDTHYSTLPVNYPNYSNVDFENLSGPFVAVELRMGETVEAEDISGAEVLIRGKILISYLYEIGVGSQGAAGYLDTIKDNLCFKKIEGINYQGMKIYNVSPYPGIVGQQAQVEFLA